MSASRAFSRVDNGKDLPLFRRPGCWGPFGPHLWQSIQRRRRALVELEFNLVPERRSAVWKRPTPTSPRSARDRKSSSKRSCALIARPCAAQYPVRVPLRCRRDRSIVVSDGTRSTACTAGPSPLAAPGLGIDHRPDQPRRPSNHLCFVLESEPEARIGDKIMQPSSVLMNRDGRHALDPGKCRCRAIRCREASAELDYVVSGTQVLTVTSNDSAFRSNGFAYQ